MGVQKEQKEKRTKEIFEKIMTENFYRLMLDSKSQIQQTQRTSSGINVKKKKKKRKKPPTFKHIIFKLNKIKGLEKKKKKLEKAREKINAICIEEQIQELYPVVAEVVKNLPAVWQTWVQYLSWEDPWRREWLPNPVFWPGEFHR